MSPPPAPPQRRFHEYFESLAQAMDHADRREPVRAYVTGLCLPGDRKSVEPLAARGDPRHVGPRHQSLHDFVANVAWNDSAVLRVARDLVLDAMERHGTARSRSGSSTTPGIRRKASTPWE